MANVATLNMTALSDFTSLDPLIVAEMWDKTIQQGVVDSEWLSRFQGGEESGKPIIEKTDLNAGGGDTINITVESDLVGDGRQGSDSLRGYEEKLAHYTYQLKVDFRRHAVAVDERYSSFKAAKAKASLAQKTMQWCARHKQNDALMKLIKEAIYDSTGAANNQVWAGGGSKDADLTASNVFDTGLMELCKTKLSGLGAKPAVTAKYGQYSEVREYYAWATERALRYLRQDAAWVAAQQSARPREGAADARNPLFTGSLGEPFFGIRPFEAVLPDHDNAASGAIGSPLEPRALLRTAITSASTTSLDFGGSSGSGTTILYTKWFPGYDYLFTSGQDASADTSEYYLAIYNLPGSTDAGKREIVKYTGSSNTGNAISGLTRSLNSSDSDYSYKHDADSLVVPCTASGVPYAFAIFVGAEALMRGYGKHREKTVMQDDDYGFVQGVGVSAIFGQEPARRRDGKARNYVVAKVAINPLA